jgi:predicted component of type VI protein secretion system
MKIRWLLSLVALFGLQACGARPSAPAAPVVPKIERLTLHIRTTAGLNDGRSVRMLVRRVAAKQFLAETYPLLVALAEKPDETILSDQLLRPRTSIQLLLPLEAGSTVGVYFFYAQPQAESWRLLVPATLGDATIEAQQHAAYLLQ